MIRLKSKRKLGEGGFSLPELMIVILILGIFASIAVPTFRNYQAKSRRGQALTNLAGLHKAMRIYHVEWTVYFADFVNVGFQPEGELNYRIGFGAAGVLNNPSYAGPGQGPGAAAVDFNTGSAAICGPAQRCQEIPYGLALPVLQATSVTGLGVWVAEASGDIDADDGVWDQITIDQSKNIIIVADDLQ